jgi:hypothetical protein
MRVTHFFAFPKPQRGFTPEAPNISQSLVQIHLHIVFSTKHRRPFLKDKEFHKAHLPGICKIGMTGAVDTLS